MHPRTGLNTEYLSDEFMDCVQACIDKALETDMLAYLYDEDRWPSGFAGGFVTVNPEYRARHLLLTTVSYEDLPGSTAMGVFHATWHRTGNGTLIACYDVFLDNDGYMTGYNMIDYNTIAKGKKWYAYLETSENSPWFNGYTNVDVMNKNAIKTFLEVTHDKYYDLFGKYFGNVIPHIFTDEPQLSWRFISNDALSDSDIMLTWTVDLDETFHATYGESLLPSLPEIIWDTRKQDSREIRCRYNEHIITRFMDAFMYQYGEWCRNHNIKFSGHLIEGSPKWHARQAGCDFMRMYDAMDIPGIDLLSDDIAVRYDIKVAKSVANQKGSGRVLCENLGVTRWSFDFRGHLFQNNWSAAAGVTLRSPHLSMYSMIGEGKRDYPASFNYQVPWYKEYKHIEDHSARLSYVLSTGKPITRIGVINPIENFWQYSGTSFLSNLRINELERHYNEINDWLTFSCLDFDFISEALLPNMLNKKNEQVFIGEMAYDVIIVPDCKRLRDTTLQGLKLHKECGVRIIFTGEIPIYINGQESDEVREFIKECEIIPFGRTGLLESLESYRLISITENGEPTEDIISNIRRDNNDLYLFAASINKPRNRHKPMKRDITIIVNGEYSVTLMDTRNGNMIPLHSEIRKGRTRLTYALYDFNSLMLKFSLHSNENPPIINVPINKMYIDPMYVKIETCEPNVLLLDMAEYRINDGAWQSCEEILRLENIARQKLGYLLHHDIIPQPWTVSDISKPHILTLRFVFDSEVDVEGIQLACENLIDTSIEFNGSMIKSVSTGYYTDIGIQTVSLPCIKKGMNILNLTVQYGVKTNLEWVYLLGDFGVRLNGNKKTIIKTPESIGIGDLSTQGFPFYGGNVLYRFRVDNAEELLIRIPQYEGALIGIIEDGIRCGAVITPPYEVSISANMRKEIGLLLFGTRQNTFGALHHAGADDINELVSHPNSWRTSGDLWCYEYKLSPFGILTTPEFYII